MIVVSSSESDLSADRVGALSAGFGLMMALVGWLIAIGSNMPPISFFGNFRSPVEDLSYCCDVLSS